VRPAVVIEATAMMVLLSMVSHWLEVAY
jgi:hypothetical protein